MAHDFLIIDEETRRSLQSLLEVFTERDMATERAGRPLLQKWEVVVAVVAVFGALAFNGWQIRLQTAALEAQTRSLKAQSNAFEAQVWQMLMQQQVEISKILIEYPKLIPYFKRGKRIEPSHKDYERVMEIADLYLDFFDGFDDDYVRALSKMGDNGTYWLLWEKYFQDAFALSPALCTRYEEVKDWYTKSVSKYAENGCRARTSNEHGREGRTQEQRAPLTVIVGRQIAEGGGETVMSEIEIVKLVVAFLSGGFAGAVLNVLVTKRRQQVEFVIKITDRYLAEFSEIGECKAILSSSPSLIHSNNLNRVRKLGDWFELIAVFKKNGYLSENLLSQVGLLSELRKFYELVTVRKNEANSPLNDAWLWWPNFDSMMKVH